MGVVLLGKPENFVFLEYYEIRQDVNVNVNVTVYISVLSLDHTCLVCICTYSLKKSKNRHGISYDYGMIIFEMIKKIYVTYY